MATQALTVVRQDSALSHEVQQWSREDVDLIKTTCFPDAKDNELKMFLHVAAKSGLDPLRKQIHALRLNGRLSFVADINGLQARAAREADFRGLPCAVVYEGDDFLWDALKGEPVKHHSTLKGRPIGAWAIVEREGMKPFVSLVRFDEYNNPRNGLWKEKPSVMVLKVAKSTALRLAYPEQLGNVYERAELDRAANDGFSREDPQPAKAPEHSFSPEAVRLADAAAKPAPAPAQPSAAQAVIDAVVVPAQPAPEPAAAPAPAPEPAAAAPARPAAPAAAVPNDRPEPSKGELRRRAWVCWQLKQKDGMTGSQFTAWAASVLGHKRPQPEWTLADVEKIEDAVQRDSALAKGE